MVKYYVLVKRKGAKKWKGAIPAKKGVSLARLRASLRGKAKPGVVTKIVSEAAVRRLLRGWLGGRSVRVRKRRFRKR